MSRNSISAPKGVFDVLGDEADRWSLLERDFYELAGRYGYRRVRLPLFEHTELFVRSVGEATDIVRKEMYTFEDRGGRSLTLRPEGTAGAARCFAEHHLDQMGLPWKGVYDGAMFRAENVQRGRYRQFSQLGVEAMGVDDPDLDVEVVELGWRFLRGLGLHDLTLYLNSIGRPGERSVFADDLREWAIRAVPDMGPEDRERLLLNPLRRVLDSKDPRMQAALPDAPRLYDHLGDASRAHFDAVQQGLTDVGVPFVVEDRLVRGLDYYTSTTFEYAAPTLDAAQNALGGGGHYDGLVELVGGPVVPGIGFALGIERILLALDAEGVGPEPAPTIDVVVCHIGDTSGVARRLLGELRGAGIRADSAAYGSRSLKSQFKRADRAGAHAAVVVGEKDLASGVVTVRDLRSGEQEQVALDTVAESVAAAVGGRGKAVEG